MTYMVRPPPPSPGGSATTPARCLSPRYCDRAQQLFNTSNPGRNAVDFGDTKAIHVWQLHASGQNLAQLICTSRKQHARIEKTLFLWRPQSGQNTRCTAALAAQTTRRSLIQPLKGCCSGDTAESRHTCDAQLRAAGGRHLHEAHESVAVRGGPGGREAPHRPRSRCRPPQLLGHQRRCGDARLHLRGRAHTLIIPTTSAGPTAPSGLRTACDSQG